MIEAQRKPASIWLFLAICFPLSWILWIPVILDKTNPVFLNLSGGPALAAMWICASRNRPPGSRARLIAFLLLLPAAWLVAMLDANLTANPAVFFKFNAWLLLPSAISACIISGAFSADTGIRSLLRGLIAPPNWHWPVIAALLIPAFLLTTATVGRILGLPVESSPGTSAARFTWITLVQFVHTSMFTAVCEEPGWRGFLLLRLQSRYSALLASVLVWLPWAAWHLPLDLTRPDGSSLASILQQRGAILLIFSVLLTWLYNRSGRSLLCVVLFHGATGSSLLALPSSPPVMMPFAIVLLILAVVTSRMWRRPQQQAMTQTA